MTSKELLRQFFFLVLLLFINQSYAQKIVLTNQDHNRAINSFAYIYQGSTENYSFDDVMKADTTRFIKNESSLEVNYEFDQPSAWCRFSIHNTSDVTNWVIKIQQSRVDTVHLYIVRENQEPEDLGLTGHFQTITQRPVYAVPFAYALSLRKNETITCYLYTHRQHGRHAAVLNIQTSSYFQNYEHLFGISIGFISGMVLLAALIGLVLFLFVRQPVYIYYSVYAISFLLLLMVDSGFAHSSLSLAKYQNVANSFTVIFYYWIAGCHLLFTVELLQLIKYKNRWIYWSGLLAGYFLCLTALVLFIPSLPGSVRNAIVLGSYYIVFPGTIYILYTVSVSVRKGGPIVYLYLAGFSFTILVGLLLTLSDLEIFMIRNLNKDLYYFTPLVEVLCMVLGLGIHFSRTLKDRFRVQLKLNQTQDEIITIQEDERRRIAQDLHDDVGNSLAAVKNMVVQNKDPQRIETEINNVITTIRSVSHNLMPVDFNEFSLVEIITHLVSKFKDHPSIVLDFDYSGQIVKLKPLTELVIYRITNEIITNIFKHSQATRALVQLIYQKDSLVITIEDNGIGINNKTKFKEGIGLRSIRLRADYIRASMNVESDDKGTLIILEIPYEKE